MQKYMYYNFPPRFERHNSGVQSTAMPPKSTSTTKQIREAGAVVHACAHLVLDDRTSKKYFGNRGFSTIKLQGVVKSSTNGKTKPDDRAQWTLNVDFTLPDTGGASHEVINVDILARNCTPGELPALRWYGVGGEWINKGIPYYVAMERKPDNCIEVQDVADVIRGIIL